MRQAHDPNCDVLAIDAALEHKAESILTKGGPLNVRLNVLRHPLDNPLQAWDQKY